MKTIPITDDYMTLSQLLKLAGIISTGGHAKFYLQENDVFVNGEQDQRRGRKLYPGDKIEIAGEGIFTVVKEQA